MNKTTTVLSSHVRTSRGSRHYSGPIGKFRLELAALQLDATEPDSFSEAVETGDKQEGEKPSSVTDAF